MEFTNANAKFFIDEGVLQIHVRLSTIRCECLQMTDLMGVKYCQLLFLPWLMHFVCIFVWFILLSVPSSEFK